MLNGVIRFALQQRVVILAAALVTMVYGSMLISQLPIDVLPSLTRPRVVVQTEAHGMAPEEVETLITIPVETSVSGATGVEAVRSVSGIGLSIVYVEFAWDVDIYTARQIVQERLSSVMDRIPSDVTPRLGPISSLLGQIMMIGMWSENGQTSPMEVRTQADWLVRKRLLAVPGVAQVLTMGGERKQFQVLVDLHALHTFGVTLHDVETALEETNLNVTGGYVSRNDREFLYRGLGRVRNLEDVEQAVVKFSPKRPVLVRDVARVEEGAQIKRGDSSVNGRDAVVLNVQKQPEADTRELTQQIEQAIKDLRPSLSSDVVVDTKLYQQRKFIDHGIHNVVEAMRDGAVLVVIILFLFLLNFRTTFITLTAIPLSVVATGLIFHWLEMSINVMTLGGIAVAIGELVDDAIVDVENIFRRLKENAHKPHPAPVIRVVYEASCEIRGAIVYGTLIVILVFTPLFALSGMAGRLFTPLAVAYIVSILASLVVSLTVTPVLSYYLLPKAKVTQSEKDGVVLRLLKAVMAPVVRLSLSRAGFAGIACTLVVAVAVSVITVTEMGTDFLPPFDEGAVQVNVYLPVGASLTASREVSRIVDKRLERLRRTEDNPDGPIASYTCRTGRAEEDEHAMGVHVSEYILELNPDRQESRQELIQRIHEVLDNLPGIGTEVEQPIAHLISHMLSGVTAQIAIKIFGEDLDEMRKLAEQVKDAVGRIPGVAEPVVESQSRIGQVQFRVDRDKLALHGLTVADVNEMIETALNGKVVSRVLEGERSFDLLVRLLDAYRESVFDLHRIPVELPNGARISLGEVAKISDRSGPNSISRDDGKRRIAVRVNTTGRDLGGAIAEIRKVVAREIDLPDGHYIEYGGQFEEQQTASKRILFLSIGSFLFIALLLFSLFSSWRLVVQVLVALPAAFIGGVFALALTGQTMSIAGMVGFISLGGIATRNGILLISHYLHLMRHEDEDFDNAMIVRGSLERLAPVLMTALTTGIGLIPLVMGGEQPGKEILYPVATVILGGLVSSTICEFLLRPGMFRYCSGRIDADQSPVDQVQGDEGS